MTLTQITAGLQPAVTMMIRYRTTIKRRKHTKEEGYYYLFPNENRFTKSI